MVIRDPSPYIGLRSEDQREIHWTLVQWIGQDSAAYPRLLAALLGPGPDDCPVPTFFLVALRRGILPIGNLPIHLALHTSGPR